jgi:hypothetical protein
VPSVAYTYIFNQIKSSPIMDRFLEPTLLKKGN